VATDSILPNTPDGHNDGGNAKSYMLIPPCARCGAVLDGDHRDPDVQRRVELHLQACHLAVLVRIERRLLELGGVIEDWLIPALARR